MSLTKKRVMQYLKTMPFRFQITGMCFIQNNGGRALVGDDMGLGKTLEILGWLALNQKKRPAIIVCPANAKYNWAEQIAEHTYMECTILEGQKPSVVSGQIIIVNYDIILYWVDELLKLKPSVLIMDECHKVKNRTAKRTKACSKLSRVCKHVIPMSGTPIINRPVEFFPVLNMMYPKEYSSFWKFAFRYCDPKPGWRGKGWNFNGASNILELHNKVKNIMIRRTKKQVLKQLPPKRRIVLPVQISNVKEYTMAKENFLHWYKMEAGKHKAKRAKKAQALVKLGQLKKLSAEGKIKQACEWIDDFLESTDEKLVVFVYHRILFDALRKKYAKVCAVGGKSGPERQKQVNKFQKNKKCRVFIGTISADKESITLTASSTVLFLELGWTPGEMDQAEDRVNRIGQKADKLNIYYILGKHTVDEYVWEIIKEKRKIINKVVDGTSRSDWDRVNFGRLINFLEKEK